MQSSFRALKMLYLENRPNRLQVRRDSVVSMPRVVQTRKNRESRVAHEVEETHPIMHMHDPGADLRRLGRSTTLFAFMTPPPARSSGVCDIRTGTNTRGPPTLYRKCTSISCRSASRKRWSSSFVSTAPLRPMSALLLRPSTGRPGGGALSVLQARHRQACAQKKDGGAARPAS